jgi:hypothetical protein
MTRRAPLPDDRAGRIYGLTWPAPLRFGGRLEARLLFWAGRNFGWVSAPLRRLAVIRVAHWSVLSHVPDGKGGRHRLRRPVLFFDASFDVDLRRYIEIFAEAIRWRFRAVWGFGAGYPGVLPSEGFLGWVDTSRTDASHYWCAYSEATTRMIVSALRVGDALAAFDAGVVASEVDDDRFSSDFSRLLSRLSGDL